MLDIPPKPHIHWLFLYPEVAETYIHVVIVLFVYKIIVILFLVQFKN